MKRSRKNRKKCRFLKKVVGIAGLAYAGLFAVYYYDLDGKLLYYVVEPFLDKHYSAMERPDATKTPYGAKESVSVEAENFGATVDTTGSFGQVARNAAAGVKVGATEFGKYGEPKPKLVKVTM
ncbi:MAG: hypothetical protein IJH91_08975 [Mogibacterium sp.]|nr:hypothetical protein [Mogibacterium sp.]